MIKDRNSELSFESTLALRYLFDKLVKKGNEICKELGTDSVGTVFNGHHHNSLPYFISCVEFYCKSLMHTLGSNDFNRSIEGDTLSYYVEQLVNTYRSCLNSGEIGINKRSSQLLDELSIIQSQFSTAEKDIPEQHIEEPDWESYVHKKVNLNDLLSSEKDPMIRKEVQVAKDLEEMLNERHWGFISSAKSWEDFVQYVGFLTVSPEPDYYLPRFVSFMYYRNPNIKQAANDFSQYLNKPISYRRFSNLLDLLQIVKKEKRNWRNLPFRSIKKIYFEEIRPSIRNDILEEKYQLENVTSSWKTSIPPTNELIAQLKLIEDICEYNFKSDYVGLSNQILQKVKEDVHEVFVDVTGIDLYKDISKRKKEIDNLRYYGPALKRLNKDYSGLVDAIYSKSIKVGKEVVYPISKFWAQLGLKHKHKSKNYWIMDETHYKHEFWNEIFPAIISNRIPPNKVSQLDSRLLLALGLMKTGEEYKNRFEIIKEYSDVIKKYVDLDQAPTKNELVKAGFGGFASAIEKDRYLEDSGITSLNQLWEKWGLKVNWENKNYGSDFGEYRNWYWNEIFPFLLSNNLPEPMKSEFDETKDKVDWIVSHMNIVNKYSHPLIPPNQPFLREHFQDFLYAITDKKVLSNGNSNNNGNGEIITISDFWSKLGLSPFANYISSNKSSGRFFLYDIFDIVLSLCQEEYNINLKFAYNTNGEKKNIRAPYWMEGSVYPLCWDNDHKKIEQTADKYREVMANNNLITDFMIYYLKEINGSQPVGLDVKCDYIGRFVDSYTGTGNLDTTGSSRLYEDLKWLESGSWKNGNVKKELTSRLLGLREQLLPNPLHFAES